MSVSGTTNSTNPLQSLLGAASTASSATPGTTGTSSQDLSKTFLTLLVAQLNNQDPLNPVDNSQLTSQMAQISTVTGIGNLNTSVTNLMAQMQQSATIQSAQLTGHTVMVQGATIAAPTGNTGGVAGISLPSAAQSVTVRISDATGQVVRTLQLGAQPAGFTNFVWDGGTDAGGTAAAGSYSYQVSATGPGGAVQASTFAAQTVVGIVPQSDGSAQLLLGDGSQVAVSAVRQIL